MKKIKIEIKETLSRIIEIESNSVEEAISRVEDLYKKEEIVLDADDHKSTDFDILSFDTTIVDEEFANFVLNNAEKMLVNLSIEELAKIGFGNSLTAIEEYAAQK